MKSSSKTLICQIGIAAAGMTCAAYCLICLLKFNATMPSPTASQDLQRLKAKADIQEVSAVKLQTYGLQNPEKGIIYIPIDRAMDLTVAEWKNPAAGRSNLMARAAIALEVPPPPEATTNQYE